MKGGDIGQKNVTSGRGRGLRIFPVRPCSGKKLKSSQVAVYLRDDNPSARTYARVRSTFKPYTAKIAFRVEDPNFSCDVEVIWTEYSQ
jgi:hypothetical protein